MLRRITTNFFSQLAKQAHQPLVDHSLFKTQDPKTIAIVCGCPADWREPHMQKYFDRYLQSIDRIIMGRDNLGQYNNTAFVFFKDANLASNFVDRYHNDFINTENVVEQLSVALYKPKTKEEKLRVKRSYAQIELYNLPFEASNMDILGLIADQSTVEDFQLPMRSMNKNKGYALITFKDAELADDFLQSINGLTMFGRELKGRARYIKFDTQKKRTGLKSDFVLSEAETEEIKIRGAMDRYAEELFRSHGLVEQKPL